MYKGNLTPKEEDIMRQLLNQHGINRYELVGAVGEGKSLPGSGYPCEIESLSGIVVTPTTAYTFWLDWENNNFTLGEEDETWSELSPEERASEYEVIEAMQRLAE